MTVGRIGDATLYTAHVLEALRAMPEESVHCVVTSPPYWGLRDYGLEPQVWGGEPGCTHEWGDMIIIPTGRNDSGEVRECFHGQSAGYGGPRNASQGAFCRLCGAWCGSLGLEPTPELYVQHIVSVFRELRRVLRADGTCWVNLGDSYATRPASNGIRFRRDRHNGNPVHSVPAGLKPKDLVGIPWRAAFALQADGWYLRSDIIWAKPNPMPESVADRPTKAHEYLFLLSKSPRYHYDAEAVREEAVREEAEYGYRHHSERLVSGQENRDGHRSGGGSVTGKNPESGRNRRSVWTIATQPFPEAHFSTFPEKLVEPCVLAGCPARVCSECGAPWVRVMERATERTKVEPMTEKAAARASGDAPYRPNSRQTGGVAGLTTSRTLGFRPTCTCGCKDTEPGVLLDPFAGSGTALLVALKLGRRAVGIELKPEYAQMTVRRLRRELGLFAAEGQRHEDDSVHHDAATKRGQG